MSNENPPHVERALERFYRSQPTPSAPLTQQEIDELTPAWMKPGLSADERQALIAAERVKWKIADEQRRDDHVSFGFRIVIGALIVVAVVLVIVGFWFVP